MDSTNDAALFGSRFLCFLSSLLSGLYLVCGAMWGSNKGGRFDLQDKRQRVHSEISFRKAIWCFYTLMDNGWSGDTTNGSDVELMYVV